MLRLLLFVAVIAVVLYVGIRWLQSRGFDDPGKAAPLRPKAPDDDPEFLRDLDRKRRRHGESDH